MGLLWVHEPRPGHAGPLALADPRTLVRGLEIDVLCEILEELPAKPDSGSEPRA